MVTICQRLVDLRGQACDWQMVRVTSLADMFSFGSWHPGGAHFRVGRWQRAFL